ncbi:hypothetical protein PNOK_0929300 [Pyrrhoderma noxium]|uniref:Uncharacterized protein n=1 Tax=Pyrrhoderma noxium TaxID=2282107 RepID=A0A286U7M4_9AGAM|nr:hypothetical protein PNOK_0929300 [Pyrrhoderma noxium]
MANSDHADLEKARQEVYRVAGEIRSRTCRNPLSARCPYYNYVAPLDLFDKEDKEELQNSCLLLLNLLYLDGEYKLSVLREIAKLLNCYQAVREIFSSLGLEDKLRGLVTEKHDIERLRTSSNSSCFHSRLYDIINICRVSLRDNAIYALCRNNFMRPHWVGWIDGTELQLDLDIYTSNPESLISTLAESQLSNFNLHAYSSMFLVNVMKVATPQCLDFLNPYERPNSNASFHRVCSILLRIATNTFLLDDCFKPLAIINEMIFRCRLARTCFNSQDAAVVLTKTVDDLTSSPLNPESVVRYTNLVEQVKLCLQDHEIYPRTSNFHHEMNESMLELILFYLRSNETFYIASRTVVYTWLDIITTAPFFDTLFKKLTEFLLENRETLKSYSDKEGVELLFAAVLGKLDSSCSSNTEILEFYLCSRSILEPRLIYS